MGRLDRALSHRGQGLTEYLLILLLIAIVAISALLFLGGGIDPILSALNATAAPSAH